MIKLKGESFTTVALFCVIIYYNKKSVSIITRFN